MSKEYSFAVMPSVSISRSRFARKSQHKTSFNLGDIVPVYLDEVLPGDTRSIDMAGLIRMSTPIAPIMDNIYIDYFAFFVPNRLVWDHWKEFCGEPDRAWTPSREYTVPRIKLDPMRYVTEDSPNRPDWSTFTAYFKDSPLDYLGGAITKEMLDPIYFNALPVRADVK